MNRLVDESSPYLRQHAANPVDWYPWGDEPFTRARRTDRPVFLSIGYSACHWCHVMAHESFEDPETAAELNRSFVSVKVDREERPDVDAVYMEAVQALTGSGGWPMSVFLTPDRKPFFGGTYFGLRDRRGSPSFRNVLAALTDAWNNHRREVDEQAAELSAAIASRSVISRTSGRQSVLDPGSREGLGGPDLLGFAADGLARQFDAEWGGFGPPPKFPHPALIDVALRSAPHMAIRTLDAMAAGGIHDHLGGGFARYATDTRWLVPHFEKMLYDQAGVLRAYLHGWQVTGRAEYRTVMDGIVDYVERDLSTPEGGLCSSEDADSEGEEGRFYLWTPAQVAQALAEPRLPDGADPDGADPDGADPDGAAETATGVCEWFGITDAGNFEGSTILSRPLGAPLVGPPEIERARRLLLDHRATRVRPDRDDKVLAEWNAMFVSSLAEAAAATGAGAWRAMAVDIAEFLVDNLRRSDGRWMRCWQRRNGAHQPAFAADHAWLVDCFTRLGELTGQARWTRLAVDCADALLALFADTEGGGFFTTGIDGEPLIVRTKDVFDGATPSTNAVAASALARLGALTGDDRYLDAARGVVDLIGELLVRQPGAFAHTVLTADLLRSGGTEVVIAGDRPDLLSVVRSRWRPDVVVAWGEPTPSPLWEGRHGDQAYVCHRFSCQNPAADPGTLAAQLQEAAP